jgi:O-antigen/teichoic acid export membrane protein
MTSVDERDLSTLLSSATLVFVGQIVYSASQLGERLVIARLLSPGAYGEVSIGLAVMSTVVTVAMVGFRQGVPRYISRYDDERDVRGAWLTGIAIAGVVGVVLSAGLVLGSGAVADRLFDRDGSVAMLAVFALAIPFNIGMQVGISAIRGLENTIYRTYTHHLLYPGLRLVILVALLTAGAGVLAAGYAYLVAAAVTFVVVHLLLNRLIPLVGAVRTHAREMLLFSIPLVISTLLSRLLTRTDTIMLGYFRPSYEVGLYGAAFPLASALILILSAFGFMYLPVASRLDSEDKRDEIDAIYKLTTKWIYVLTFPAFLTLVVFPGDVLSVVFGTQYAPASTALSILAIGFFTRAAFGRSRETISALGYTNYLLVTNAFAFIVNVGLNLLLIPRYGSTGAAVASAVSFVGLNLAVFVFLDRRFGISPFSKSTLRAVVVLPFFLFPPALLLASRVSLSPLTLLAFLIAASISSVVIVAATGCLQPEDKIPIAFVEDRIGIEVPLIRRFVPEPS